MLGAVHQIKYKNINEYINFNQSKHLTKMQSTEFYSRNTAMSAICEYSLPRNKLHIAIQGINKLHVAIQGINKLHVAIQGTSSNENVTGTGTCTRSIII